MGKELRYGHVEGPGKGKELPMAASQYFARRGGKFAYLSSGRLTCNATITAAVAGWVVTPKDATGKNAWMSSAGDKCFCIRGLEDVFEMPAYEANASVNATAIGMSGLPWNVGATYAMVQYCNIKPGKAASPLTIVDVDTVNRTVLVKIKPKAMQAV